MKAVRAPPRSNPPSAPHGVGGGTAAAHPGAASRSCIPVLHPAAAPGARGHPPVAHPSLTAAPGWDGGNAGAPQALCRGFGGSVRFVVRSAKEGDTAGLWGGHINFWVLRCRVPPEWRVRSQRVSSPSP